MSDPDWKRPAARRVRAVRDRLRLVYGIPGWKAHGHPIAELVLTVLSQSTNDRNRDVAYLRLRERLDEGDVWRSLRDAPVDVIEEAIRPGGISKVKSARIKEILEAITATAPDPGDGDDPLWLDWLADRSVPEAQAYLTSLPGVVEGIVWSGIWDANVGLFNSALTSFHLIDHYQVFLGDNRWLTILLIEIVQVWQITPLSALLVLAALQNIPDDLYEAAHLDGCSAWSRFTRITLPLIRPGISVAMVQALILTLNVFDQPYVLNGAAETGASLTMQTYFISFQNLDFGAGYALSLLITLATLILSAVVVSGLGYILMQHLVAEILQAGGVGTQTLAVDEHQRAVRTEIAQVETGVSASAKKVCERRHFRSLPQGSCLVV